MAARQIIVPGAMPSRDENGRTLPGKFRFYVPGATLSTPATVYTDATLTVAHPFPILSDSAGRWPQIWADDADSFDVGWTDQVFDQQIKVFNDVSPAEDAALASVSLAEAAADEAVLSAAEAAASALVAAGAAMGVKLTATSHTSNTIATGSHSFTLDQDADFAEGMMVKAAETSAAAVNSMFGTVTNFTGGVLTLLVPVGGTSGSGTHTDWTLSIAANGGVVSVAGLQGIISAANLKAALAVQSADISDLEDTVAGIVLVLA